MRYATFTEYQQAMDLHYTKKYRIDERFTVKGE